eukprot:2756042-Pyramimonas_sp.AAC.1
MRFKLCPWPTGYNNNGSRLRLPHSLARTPAPARDFLALYSGIALSLWISLHIIQESLSRRSGIALSLETCLQITNE